METQRRGLKKIWKPPSFEDFNIESHCKRIKLDEDVEKIKGSEICTIYEPKTVDELATHPKKVEELKNWLQIANLSKSPMLLITGPAGSAKTATLKVVASTLNMSLKEWINPLDKANFNSEGGPMDKSEYTECRQSDKFEDFIFRSSRYKSLFDDDGKTVILVEDFPNIFLHDAKLFYEFLGRYEEKGKSPIVFICTDDQNLNMSNDLFPNSIKTKYNITEIRFNPVNQTSLMRTLKKVLSKCSDKDAVSADTLQSIAHNSNGDIRNALANLQILVASSKPKKGKKPTRPKEKCPKSESSSSELLSIKDSRADFYQALGRVLYPKSIGKVAKTEGNVGNEKRIFVHDVNEISNSFSDSFLMLLHENYVSRFNNLESVSEAAKIFSLCDYFLGESELREYAGLVSVVGLMVNNKEPKREGFKPIKKSSALYHGTKDVWAKRFEYSHLNTTYRILNLDIIPYMEKLRICKGPTLQKNEATYVIEEFDD